MGLRGNWTRSIRWKVMVSSRRLEEGGEGLACGDWGEREGRGGST